MDSQKALACLDLINPASLSYDDWLSVGMALCHEGCSASDWDSWSRQDAARYKPGDCKRKWDGFRDSDHPKTVASLCAMAIAQGHKPPSDDDGGRELAWDAVIGGREAAVQRGDLTVIRQEWLQSESLPAEPNWKDGRHELTRYLQLLFQSDERVGIVTESWKEPKSGKWLPKQGYWDRTAGELLEALSKASDLGAVIGDWTEECGAWIRFNPLDGSGCSDKNITSHRFALVECDDVEIGRQLAIYKELELPIAVLVHSGKRSLHAIVRIDAPDYKEYQKRVDFLYEVCGKNGLKIDRQNRNPSRLSRLPGATRAGVRQWIVGENVGKATWAEWSDWIAAQNDDLPDVENLSDVWANMPPLAPCLIDGVLRQGHKMLLSGSSKAGKSFLLLQLAIAIAEGKTWLGWQCAPGRVLYVNLELDRASALHRLPDTYRGLGLAPDNKENIDMWHLRGKALPMTELAPKLIRRALKKRYSCVIIDPIYKVITGDENAADQMAKFCNQFDRVCHELGAAVIYCHHHSKGDQGQKKAHDRASGSGVFARDPDALLDLIELELTEKRRENISNRWECDAIGRLLDAMKPDWRQDCPQDDAIVAKKLSEYAIPILGLEQVGDLLAAVRTTANLSTGWRIEGILREFPGFPAKRIFFKYPCHYPDIDGLLEDARATGEEPERRNRQEAIEDKTNEMIEQTINAVQATVDKDGLSSILSVAEYLGITDRAVRDRLKKAGIKCSKGVVVPPNSEAEVEA